jgi:hypothetical protein
LQQISPSISKIIIIDYKKDHVFTTFWKDSKHKKSEKINKLVTKAHKTLQQKLYECVIERGNNRK